jgi:NADPH2:quinone reductase
VRAVAIRQFGDQPQLIDLPTPSPGPDEVQVELRAASLNPMDLDLISGAMGKRLPFLQFAFPLIAGVDGAGTVSAVGDRVKDFVVGDRVFGQFWANPTRGGTFAESTVVPVSGTMGAITATPDALSDRDAAAAPTAGFTALGAVLAAEIGQGDQVLVVGATGGVGMFAVQFAAARGATVIATTSPDASDRLQQLGAADTIDYRSQPIDDILAPRYPRGIDAILDLRGDPSGISAIAGHVRDGGAIISIQFGVGDELQADSRRRCQNYVAGPERKLELLRQVGQLLTDGSATAVIDREVALHEVSALLAPSQTTHARGKTVVQI